ncbi:MAG: DHHA1 domain-containing protein [Halarsenatibacteraceae bacterium]
MTERIYYNDSFMKEFKADITDYLEVDGKYHLQLNKTAFYPEGGGQPADHGSIGVSNISHVYEKDGEIFHIADNLPAEKSGLSCKINWERRFDLMQQHSGQHLLSAVAEDLYQARTVGFHLEDSSLTIDTDIQLSQSEIKKLEIKCNQLIYENRDISVEYPGDQDDTRIVKLSRLAEDPCGGTHLNSTGQIGIISIIGSENYKAGSRLHFACGQRAVEDYRFKNRLTAFLRDKLSVNNQNIKAEITRLLEELNNKSNTIDDLKGQLLKFKEAELIKAAEEIGNYRLIVDSFADLSFKEVRDLASQLVSDDNIAVVFGQQDGDTTRMILARSENITDLNLNPVIQEVMPLLDGNGGGQPGFVQGGGSNPEKLPEAVSLAREIIINSLK